MLRRKLLTPLLAIAVILGSGLGLASPASAAVTHNVTVNCVSSTLTFSPTSLTAESGDSIAFLNSSGNTISVTLFVGLIPTSVPDSWSNGTTGTVLVTSGGSTTFIGRGGTCDNVEAAFTVTVGGGGGGSSSSSSSSAPSSVTQQFGLPSTGTCDESAPESLNWAGVASGGWGVSWAQWMNNGNGGAVCTRTLGYVGSGWTVS